MQTAEDYFARAYPDAAYREERKRIWDEVVVRVEATGMYEDLGDAEIHEQAPDYESSPAQ